MCGGVYFALDFLPFFINRSIRELNCGRERKIKTNRLKYLMYYVLCIKVLNIKGIEIESISPIQFDCSPWSGNMTSTTLYVYSMFHLHGSCLWIYPWQRINPILLCVCYMFDGSIWLDDVRWQWVLTLKLFDWLN